MLKILIKKQFLEVFKGFFYNSKKSTMRSRKGIVASVLLFTFLMVIVMGGMFTLLAIGLCGAMVQAGVGWLYFFIMSSIAIVFGAFASVFNTYSGLYLAKDNEILLSLPIPVRLIVASRLLNVYLMGTMYVAIVFIPALIVYWVVAKANALVLLCGVVLFLVITALVLFLSCLLGWVVAKISRHLKNKSFITVLIAVACIGIYYFVYFKANVIIRDIAAHAEAYAASIRGKAYVLYMFGSAGTGNLAATAAVAGISVLLLAGMFLLLSRTFFRLAAEGNNAKKVEYRQKAVKEKSVFAALLHKEFARFTSSAGYMLNCGIGVLFMPVAGVVLLIKGRFLFETMASVPFLDENSIGVIVCFLLCLLASMNDIAAPSVSLEGKNLWILQSLPVAPASVLYAKLCVQLSVTAMPLLFACLCAAFALPVSVGIKVMMVLTPLVYTLFISLFGMFIAVKMPLLHWTSEITPIKQSGGVAIVLFGGWGISMVPAGLYLVLHSVAGAVVYLLVWCVLYLAASVCLFRWLSTAGSRLFEELTN